MKTATSLVGRKRGRAGRILTAGVVVAVLDGLFAVLLNVVLLGVTTPVQLFQFIASGLLGQAAFTGGLAAAALGVVLHFMIAYAWVMVFSTVVRHSTTLQRMLRATYGAAKVGLMFGVLVWLAMDLIVLPLSGAAPTPVLSGRFLILLAWHAVGVGWPIALIVRPDASRGSQNLSENAGRGMKPPP